MDNDLLESIGFSKSLTNELVLRDTIKYHFYNLFKLLTDDINFYAETKYKLFIYSDSSELFCVYKGHRFTINDLINWLGNNFTSVPFHCTVANIKSESTYDLLIIRT